MWSMKLLIDLDTFTLEQVEKIQLEKGIKSRKNMIEIIVRDAVK